MTSTTTSTSTIDEHENEEVERANASGRTPVVFVHGLWLLASSWDRWATVFEDAGYSAVRPGWPDDPETVEQAKAHPEVFAGKSIGDIADHIDEIIRRLDKKPAVIGHSFGGLLAQDHRRTRARRGHGCGRPGAVSRRPPAPNLRASVCLTCTRQPGEPKPRRSPHLRAVPLRLRQRGRRGRGEGALRDLRSPRLGRTGLPSGGGEPEPLE